MSQHVPIYSQVAPKTAVPRSKSSNPAKLGKTREEEKVEHRNGETKSCDVKLKLQKDAADRRRSREEARPRRSHGQHPAHGQPPAHVQSNHGALESESKVEAYLRQNQHQSRRHAVKHAEHRVNLRSLPVSDGLTPRGLERTPIDRPRDRDERRELRREREREREDRDPFDAEGISRNPLSPSAVADSVARAENRLRRSNSTQQELKNKQTSDQAKRFYCREWALQKLAHCLERATKTQGALILGDSGSGKTSLCRELTRPGVGPAARQQRALNRRLLAHHFMQSDKDASLQASSLVRALVASMLAHSTKLRKIDSDNSNCGNSNEERCRPERTERAERADQLSRRFHDLALEDMEDGAKPLLDSEDQRTDEEEPLIRDAPLSCLNEVPDVLPRASKPNTNPFISIEDKNLDTQKIYENHENVFLRNISQRQSKEIRNSRLLRQSSEPLTDRKASLLQKSYSIEQNSTSSENEKEKKIENGSPTNVKISRIPVANFRYPNKSGLGSSSNESSPHKKSDPKKSEGSVEENEKVPIDDPISLEDRSPSLEDQNVPEESQNPRLESHLAEVVEYQNILNDLSPHTPEEILKRVETDDVPPPIPSLPVNPRTVIADAYYDKLITDPEMQEALKPENLEKNPDECFKRAFLFPLLEIDPPKQCLFMLVDAIDEGTPPSNCIRTDGRTVSRTPAELLANHQQLLPQWLLLVCTARKQSKRRADVFTGFRRIVLDELARAHVSADVQRYVLARLDSEPRLRARVSRDTNAAVAALDHLRIKSDGCLLYLEKVLDGIADGLIALREVREIPGTLNGLYLWLAQRIFHGRRFAKVRSMLEVVLAARCGVSEELLYKCQLLDNYSLTTDDFNRRMHLLRRILTVDPVTGYLSVFHHSFRSWLLDVKHCTRRYLCSVPRGHHLLAMYYTLEARRLSGAELEHYAYHMAQLELSLPSKTKGCEDISPHTLVLLWAIDAGCRRIQQETANCIAVEKSDTERKTEEDGDPLNKLPEWIAPLLEGSYEPRRTSDARVLRFLVELGSPPEEDTAAVSEDTSPHECAEDRLIEISTNEPTSMEPACPIDSTNLCPEVRELPIVDVCEDRTLAHQLAQRGDEKKLARVLQQWPELVCALDACGATPLHAAARHGRATCVALLIARGARVDAADADGWSPLRAAAWAGHTEVVEALLEHGCLVDCVDADNRTALRAAAWSGHETVVALLLDAGASPDRADAEGRTPLIAAAYMGHADIVRLLLDHGAKVDHADEDGRTALSVAALCAGGAQTAALLLERGADVNKADRDGATPLLVAAFEGHAEICSLLLESEADVEASDTAGRTALWAAACAGHAEAVRLLLFWGACVDGMDQEGRTVLSVAAAQGNVEVVRALLDRGLDEHHRDNAGWTPLHYAAFEGHTEVCTALLEAGAKVDEADNDGKGALMLAAQEGHTSLVEMLIDDWGAPVDQRAHDGKTAFRAAALEQQLECCAALVSRGADPDALDADRRSTLYVLALDNRAPAARFLLAHCHAAVHIPDTEGRTPLHVSAWQGHTEMVELLLTVGRAAVDGRDRCQRTALHAAAWRGRAAALRCLLKHGADPAAVCSQGATPLGIAAQEGHEECVLWLLQHGADPLQADSAGRTPAKVAWRAGHAGFCRLLERWCGGAGVSASGTTTGVVIGTTTGLLTTGEADGGTDTSGSTAETRVCTAALVCPVTPHRQGSPELKRRSIHSSNSAKSNLTGGSALSTEVDPSQLEKRANLELSFAQQVERCGRGPRDRHRDRNRQHERHGRDHHRRGDTSPLYASPPRSPPPQLYSPVQPTAPFGTGSPTAPSATASAAQDPHFARDTHMRIILGRRERSSPARERDKTRSACRRLIGSLRRVTRRTIGKQQSAGKSKRNGIVTNPAMRLVANVRNGLDHAAANIRRTGVALAASAGANNPAVKTDAFQWRRETPL